MPTHDMTGRCHTQRLDTAAAAGLLLIAVDPGLRLAVGQTLDLEKGLKDNIRTADNRVRPTLGFAMLDRASGTCSLQLLLVVSLSVVHKHDREARNGEITKPPYVNISFFHLLCPSQHISPLSHGPSSLHMFMCNNSGVTLTRAPELRNTPVGEG